MQSINALKLWHEICVNTVQKKEADLSSRQNAVLLKVYLDANSQTVGNLAKTLDISKSAVTRAVDRLEKEGFVKRKFKEDDKRIVVLQRTVKGSVFLREMGELILTATKKI